ncbi:hypothetical protein Hanom_Chr14g01329471 [Helianthus anomalus]
MISLKTVTHLSQSSQPHRRHICPSSAELVEPAPSVALSPSSCSLVLPANSYTTFTI